MRLEDQVCTLEQAKFLENAGIGPWLSVCYWVFDCGMKWRVIPEGYFNSAEDGIDWHPAFTVAELGEMLPSEWHQNDNRKFWPKRRGDLDWIGGDEAPFLAETFTEAECRAAVLIHMLNEGDTTAEEVNARLTAQSATS